MQVDSFFIKGVSHKVCEDYTMHGVIHGNPFIVVCDGCSGSDDTDFGARLLARSVRSALETMMTKYYVTVTSDSDRMLILQDEITKNLSSMLMATYADVSVADATMILAFQYGDKLYITHRGDGTYAIGGVDGTLNVVDIIFPTGAPYYLSYDLDPLNKREYKRKFGGVKLLRQTRFIKDVTVQTTIESPFYEKSFYSCHIDDVSFVSVMSDGVSAFQYKSSYVGDRDPDITTSLKITKELLAYKNFAGEFVQRRMNKAMRTLDKDGLENFDDVAIATIKFGE